MEQYIDIDSATLDGSLAPINTIQLLGRAPDGNPTKNPIKLNKWARLIIRITNRKRVVVTVDCNEMDPVDLQETLGVTTKTFYPYSGNLVIGQKLNNKLVKWPNQYELIGVEKFLVSSDLSYLTQGLSDGVHSNLEMPLELPISLS